MRFWSIHPKYLDTNGLVAMWKELVQTKYKLWAWSKDNSLKCGYINHSGYQRFKQATNTMDTFMHLMNTVYIESLIRKHKFNDTYLVFDRGLLNIEDCIIPVNKGQIDYECAFLYHKMGTRKKNKDKERMKLLLDDYNNNNIKLNPIFKIVDGPVESWEKVKDHNYKYSLKG